MVIATGALRLAISFFQAPAEHGLHRVPDGPGACSRRQHTSPANPSGQHARKTQYNAHMNEQVDKALSLQAITCINTYNYSLLPESCEPIVALG